MNYTLQQKALIIQNSRGQFNKGVELQEDFMKEICKKENLNIEFEICDPLLFRNCTIGNYETCEKAYKLMGIQKHTIFFGGDHYSSFGPILASLKKYGNNFSLIWIDAHTDIHSFESSPSKNMHGMIVRFLMNHEYKDIPQLQPHQILYIGIRSVEEEEWNFIYSNDIKHIKMNDIKNNKKECLNKVYNFIKNSYVHISLDVDSLDPKIMYSTGTAEEDGMSLDELYEIVNIIREKSLGHYATDIMEYNPTIGSEDEKKISYKTFCNIFKYFINL
jgi:arginase